MICRHTMLALYLGYLGSYTGLGHEPPGGIIYPTRQVETRDLGLLLPSLLPSAAEILGMAMRQLMVTPTFES